MKIRGNTIGTTMKPEKTVVKCENLTEEEKARARDNIGVVPMLIVTNEGIQASHTSGEIYAHVQAGGTVVFDVSNGVCASFAGAYEDVAFFIAYQANARDDDIVAGGIIVSYEIDRDGNITDCGLHIRDEQGIENRIYEVIGPIDDALQEIIAIQNKLIGGDSI